MMSLAAAGISFGARGPVNADSPARMIVLAPK
jgi:hypothetical protein